MHAWRSMHACSTLPDCAPPSPTRNGRYQAPRQMRPMLFDQPLAHKTPAWPPVFSGAARETRPSVARSVAHVAPSRITTRERMNHQNRCGRVAHGSVGSTPRRSVETPQSGRWVSAGRPHGTVSQARLAVRLIVDQSRETVSVCVSWVPSCLRPFGASMSCFDHGGRFVDPCKRRSRAA
jgi:hypothetical protein